MPDFNERVARALCRAGGEDPDSMVEPSPWAGVAPARYPRWRLRREAADDLIKAVGARDVDTLDSFAQEHGVDPHALAAVVSMIEEAGP